MTICLQAEILNQLSCRGILAYVAVMEAGDQTITSARLAGMVKCQTGIMKEGLKELAAVAPEVVVKSDKGDQWWQCGAGGEVQLLDTANRYRRFVEYLKRYWDFMNPSIPFPFSARDGSACRQFLNDHENWDEPQWADALRNRVISVRLGNASRTEDFYKWVRNLGDYMGGAMNEFKKPVEGSGNGKAIAVEVSTRTAAAAYLAGAHS